MWVLCQASRAHNRRGRPWTNFCRTFLRCGRCCWKMESRTASRNSSAPGRDRSPDDGATAGFEAARSGFPTPCSGLCGSAPAGLPQTVSACRRASDGSSLSQRAGHFTHSAVTNHSGHRIDRGRVRVGGTVSASAEVRKTRRLPLCANRFNSAGSPESLRSGRRGRAGRLPIGRPADRPGKNRRSPVSPRAGRRRGDWLCELLQAN